MIDEDRNQPFYGNLTANFEKNGGKNINGNKIAKPFRKLEKLRSPTTRRLNEITHKRSWASQTLAKPIITEKITQKGTLIPTQSLPQLSLHSSKILPATQQKL